MRLWTRKKKENKAMHKRFKHTVHREVCKALIKAIKSRKPNEYDTQTSQEIIKAYFYDAEKGIRQGLCFCPDDAALIHIFETEIEKLKGL